MRLGNTAGRGSAKRSPAVLGRRGWIPPHETKHESGNELESLFTESLKLPPKTVQPATSSVLEPFKHIDILKKLYGLEKWNYFVQHFGPDSRNAHPSHNQPAYVKTTAREVFSSIVHLKRDNRFLSSDLPSVTEISNVFVRMGILNGGDWDNITAPLILELLRIKKDLTGSTTHERYLLDDLIGTWKVVCRRVDGLPALPVSIESLDWSHLPPISVRDANQLNQKLGTQALIGELFPFFLPKDKRGFPRITLATFALLTGESPVAKVVRAENESFVNLLGRVVGTPELDFSKCYGFVKGSNPEPIVQSMEKDWDAIRERAAAIAATTSNEREQAMKKNLTKFTARTKVSFFGKRLSEALDKKDPVRAAELWSEASKWPAEPENARSLPSRDLLGTLSRHQCNQFILLFMTLRDPDKAIDVWNHMIQIGLQPDVKTWTVMLEGARNARDVQGMEDIWRRMQAVGVKLDEFCWATRIHGLIDNRELDLAIQALDDMGRIWLACAQKQYPKKTRDELQELGSIEGAVKPDIRIVNGAVDKLLTKRRDQAANRILAWAGGLGIKPNIDTYNVLLKSQASQGNSEGISNVLGIMEKAGVKADIVTFTTMLNMLTQYQEDRTPEENVEAINSVLTGMEAAGVKPNTWTYGKMISQLLQNPQSQIKIVNLLLDRMAQMEMRPSAHIFTNVLMWHFQQNPPDLDAIRSIMDYATSILGPNEKMFWDRVVYGYASIGETGAAVRILGQLEQEKGKVSWGAILELLIRLCENREWETARALVRNAGMVDGMAFDREGSQAEVDFWTLAREKNLLAEAP